MGRGLILLGMVIVLSLLTVAPAHALTREEYVAQADPICAKADRDTTMLWKRFLRLNKQFKLHGAANALDAIGRTNLAVDNEHRLIPPPPGDEAAINGWLDLWDQIGQKWILAGSAYRHGKYRRVEYLIRSTGPLAKRADALIAGFGFQHCGGP